MFAKREWKRMSIEWILSFKRLLNDDHVTFCCKNKNGILIHAQIKCSLSEQTPILFSMIDIKILFNETENKKK